MSVKGSLLIKTLSTHLAGERLLSSVNTYVGFKAHFLSETLSTLRACVRLFSSMNSHVDIKVSFSVETSSTLLADERLLSSVNSHVFFLSFDVDRNSFHTVGRCKAFLRCELSRGFLRFDADRNVWFVSPNAV